MYPIPSRNSSIARASIRLGNGNDTNSDSLPVMHIKIHSPTKVATHPVETGSVIMDNKVIEPIEIEATCMLYISAYNNWMDNLCNALYNKSDQTYVIQTKTDLFEDLILEDMIEEQSKDKFDIVTLILRFRQMLKADVSKEAAKGNGYGGSGNSNENNSGKSKSQNISPANNQDKNNVASGEAPTRQTNTMSSFQSMLIRMVGTMI